jgi:hypothetical protein
MIPPTLIIPELIHVVLPSTSTSSTRHTFLKNLQKGITLTSAPDAIGEVADLRFRF